VGGDAIRVVEPVLTIAVSFARQSTSPAGHVDEHAREHLHAGFHDAPENQSSFHVSLPALENVRETSPRPGNYLHLPDRLSKRDCRVPRAWVDLCTGFDQGHGSFGGVGLPLSPVNYYGRNSARFPKHRMDAVVNKLLHWRVKDPWLRQSEKNQSGSIGRKLTPRHVQGFRHGFRGEPRCFEFALTFAGYWYFKKRFNVVVRSATTRLRPKAEVDRSVVKNLRCFEISHTRFDVGFTQILISVFSSFHSAQVEQHL